MIAASVRAFCKLATQELTTSTGNRLTFTAISPDCLQTVAYRYTRFPEAE